MPRGRTGKIQGTGDILSELEMNAAKEIEENNSTPVPIPSEEDKEEEKKKEESEKENEDYEDSGGNKTDENRRTDKKIRGQGFKEDLKLEDNGKENENKVKEKNKSKF